MTAEEEILAAARLLRETAAEATPGPWRCIPDFSDHAAAVVAPNEKGWDALVLDLGFSEAQRQGRWIALASPVIAEPIADWMADVASGTRGHAARDAALKVARALIPPTQEVER